MVNTEKGKHKMFIQPILGWFKSLSEDFKKPQTYGSALENYIAANRPVSACDIDRLTREFEYRMTNRQHGGFPV
jgi:hypothetical protein